jgi:hypothetical protein
MAATTWAISLFGTALGSMGMGEVRFFCEKEDGKAILFLDLSVR